MRASELLSSSNNCGRVVNALRTFFIFSIKQAWACLFGGLMLALLLATHLWYPVNAFIPRYDALTLSALAIQIILIKLGLETWKEAKVILLFHIAGTGMEIFKTAVGSWIYPEFAYLRIGGVPLFTGFMYASVGSYISRASSEFELRFIHHPSLKITIALSMAVYINFFLHHYWFDFRYALMGCAAFVFRRCWAYFRISTLYHRMPLLLGFILIAVFIWVAENIGTFSYAWVYPHQREGWSIVSIGKLGSWFMLIMMSYAIVTLINRPRTFNTTATEQIKKPS